MHPNEQEKLHRLLGEYLSSKLNNSQYKHKTREEQLAYLLGISFTLIELAADTDSQVLDRLLAKFRKVNK